MRMISLWFAGFIAWYACASLAIEATSSVKVTPLLKTQTSWDGTALEYPKGKAEITGMIVEIAPGGETGWHLHPVPSFGMLLEGELEVTLKTGAKKIIKQGEALAEVVNTLHNGRAISKTAVKILVFYAGSTDSKITEKAPAETKPAATIINSAAK
ncbi:MAG TPA: cupin domain-containing protein [Cellvibrionaceae bacterium]|nr:cupin domain-containing protein [Cellvibrionaceae bacterium]HMW73427.1 cupin domain-containing protein [Cellvibrionaceae bacterium]HMY38493.1 cupin domain-containing protein [Marinagarivorans sp.]HNG61327.1 cupin domain-containing protein [Cellvibrionaceae bacterium]